MSLTEGLIIVATGFCTGFGLEFSKWLFEKIRKIEKKVASVQT